MVSLDVLLQVIFAAETLVADGAREWSQSSVNPLVACQLFVASERLATVWLITYEWAFTCKQTNGQYKSVRWETVSGTNLCECECVPSTGHCWRRILDSVDTGIVWASVSSSSCPNSWSLHQFCSKSVHYSSGHHWTMLSRVVEVSCKSSWHC